MMSQLGAQVDGLSGARDKLGAAPGSGQVEPGVGSVEAEQRPGANGSRSDVTPEGSSSRVHVASQSGSVPEVESQSQLGSVVGGTGSIAERPQTLQTLESKSDSPRARPELRLALLVSVTKPRGSPSGLVASVVVMEVARA